MGPKWYQKMMRSGGPATAPDPSGNGELGFQQRIRQEPPESLTQLRDTFKAATEAANEIGRASNGMHAVTPAASALLTAYGKTLSKDRQDAFLFARGKIGTANIDLGSYIAIELIRLALDPELVNRALEEARTVLADERKAYSEHTAFLKREYGLETRSDGRAEKAFGHMESAISTADRFIREASNAFGDRKLNFATGQLVGSFA